MKNYVRRGALRVRGGKVQHKNRHQLTPHYMNYKQATLVIDRIRPGRGYRHVLRKSEVERFIALIPDWERLSNGLDAIVLDRGSVDLLGWYGCGVVAICAWDRDHTGGWTHEFVEEHRGILDRLGVPVTEESASYCNLAWTDQTIKGFQLMHILLHELGHHNDMMTTKSQVRPSRGEPFAEDFANSHATGLWDTYFDTFGY